MLFKFVTVATAFAALVSGSAITLDARQVGELAACTIRTTPSNTPNPTSGLLDEFILGEPAFLLHVERQDTADADALNYSCQ